MDYTDGKSPLFATCKLPALKKLTVELTPLIFTSLREQLAAELQIHRQFWHVLTSFSLQFTHQKRCSTDQSQSDFLGRWSRVSMKMSGLGETARFGRAWFRCRCIPRFMRVVFSLPKNSNPLSQSEDQFQRQSSFDATLAFLSFTLQKRHKTCHSVQWKLIFQRESNCGHFVSSNHGLDRVWGLRWREPRATKDAWLSVGRNT